MTTHDAIVIGGGVVGASAAYHLARAGVRTLLIDRRDVGRATDAGAGILSTAANIDDPDPIERFEARAAACYPVLIEHLRADDAGDTGYAACGSLTVAIEEDELAHLRQILTGERRWRAAKDHGYAEIGPDAASALFPPLAPVKGAIYCGCGARVDGRLLAGALLRAARTRGLEVRDAPVEDVVVERGAVAGVLSAGERIACGHVVIAAGAWSKELGARLGTEIPVAPQRGQIIHLGLPGIDTGAWPIVLAFRGHYLVPWADGRVAVGATRETGSGFAPHTTAAGILEVLTEALRVAPGLAGAEIREIRVGLRPASRDGLPILGPVPGIRNLLLATGHGATGLQLGPYSGKVVAGMIAGGEAETDLGRFGLERFARSR
jgi:D-amino-acid dehydrogenase